MSSSSCTSFFDLGERGTWEVLLPRCHLLFFLVFSFIFDHIWRLIGEMTYGASKIGQMVVFLAKSISPSSITQMPYIFFLPTWLPLLHLTHGLKTCGRCGSEGCPAGIPSRAFCHFLLIFFSVPHSRPFSTTIYFGLDRSWTRCERRTIHICINRLKTIPVPVVL